MWRPCATGALIAGGHYDGAHEVPDMDPSEKHPRPCLEKSKNMRRLLISPFLICLSIHGQEFHRVAGYFGGGFTTPLDDFGSRHDTGWNILAGGGIRLTRMVGLNFEYSFNQLGYNFSPNPVLQASPLDGTTKLHGFTANPRFTTPSIFGVNTFVTAGYGIYNRRFELTRPGVGSAIYCDPYWWFCTDVLVPVDVAVGERSTWKQGWNFGGGLEFGGRMKFFADIRYMWVATPNIRTKALPVSFGVRF